jgi:hypothetical protein
VKDAAVETTESAAEKVRETAGSLHKESVEAAEQNSLQSVEADDGAANKLAEDSPSHAAGSEEESFVVDDIPAFGELQELSSEVAEGHIVVAPGEIEFW